MLLSNQIVTLPTTTKDCSLRLRANSTKRSITSVRLFKQPFVPPARFQLGLAQLAIGNFADAGENFHQLATKEEDVQSVAYVGYCFNKKRVPIAAIPWYERAIDKGADSASVYNNLGASYLDAPPVLQRMEQFRRAEYYLNKALLSDPTSQAVQLNLIRCATREADLGSDVDPWHVWRTARTVLKNIS